MYVTSDTHDVMQKLCRYKRHFRHTLTPPFALSKLDQESSEGDLDVKADESLSTYYPLNFHILVLLFRMALELLVSDVSTDLE
jgi:hypothetical protein